MELRRTRPLVLIASTVAIFLLHSALPVGSGGWHWLHLVAQELFYVPILLAAAWTTQRGVLLTTLAVSLLSSLHSLLAWRGFQLLQADQAAAVVSYWVAAGLAATLFDRRRRAEAETREAHEETLTALASSLELRERYIESHSERVRAYTFLLAERMGIRDPTILETFALGAFLHDIGKIGISDAVLLKDGPLTETEWAVMRRHPSMGAQLIGQIPFLTGARELVLAHHERFDGKGYPAGLSGEGIPLGARIFAVADTLDAVTTERIYRRARSFEEAAAIIQLESGAQFDPAVVAAFESVAFGDWALIASRLGLAMSRSTTDAL